MGSVFSRVFGAILRAALVVLLIAIPSALLPETNSDTMQIAALVAIVAAIFTISEYSARYPSLVEFRDAPPFNRIRFVSLFLTVFILTLICRSRLDPTTLTEFFGVIGSAVGHVIDFPYSPVSLVVLMMPKDLPVELLASVRTAAGISYLVSILSLAIFVLMLRGQRWPGRSEAFNVWVNLPTFDPTKGGDVVARLDRDSAINLILGFLLPFIIPAVVKFATDAINPISLADPHTLIWTMTAWAFLPASLLMRGLALAQVSRLIGDARRQAYAEAQDDGLLVV